MAFSARNARLAGACHLPGIERSAAQLFCNIADLAWLVDGDSISESVHNTRIAHGLTWVAEDADSRLVGFLSSETESKRLHILEIAVVPEAQR